MPDSRGTILRLGAIPLKEIKKGNINPFLFPQYNVFCLKEENNQLIFCTQEYVDFGAEENADESSPELIALANFSPLDYIVYWVGSFESINIELREDGPRWLIVFNYIERDVIINNKG